MIAVHERGLAQDVELLPTNTVQGHELTAANPLGKVPTLVLDETGASLFDSFVIVYVLNGMGSGPVLIPRDTDALIDAIRRHALADGIMEASVASVMERRRPEEKVWSGFMKSQRAKIERGIDHLEKEVEEMDNTVDVATISAGAALGYLDFRLPELDWRSGHPALTDWFAQFSTRPSMIATEPHDP